MIKKEKEDYLKWCENFIFSSNFPPSKYIEKLEEERKILIYAIVNEIKRQLNVAEKEFGKDHFRIKKSYDLVKTIEIVTGENIEDFISYENNKDKQNDR